MTQKKKRDYKAEYAKRMAKAKAETGQTYNENRQRGHSTGKGTPTGDTYAGFQYAFDFFNRALFEGKLPACMITLRTFGKARGYFKADSFANLDTITTVHEIALDPRQFMDRTAAEVLSTLVHEMCHLWQAEKGNPSRNAYHNAEWGEQMRSVGLIPSDTGKPGGKGTGQKVSHYIEEGGRFDTEAQRLLKTGKFKAAWVDVEGFLLTPPDPKSPTAKLAPTAKPKGKSGQRIKYTCEVCQCSVWGKGELRIACGGTLDEPHEPSVM